jgi:hypothetical protein
MPDHECDEQCFCFDHTLCKEACGCELSEVEESESPDLADGQHVEPAEMQLEQQGDGGVGLDQEEGMDVDGGEAQVEEDDREARKLGASMNVIRLAQAQACAGIVLQAVDTYEAEVYNAEQMVRMFVPDISQTNLVDIISPIQRAAIRRFTCGLVTAVCACGQILDAAADDADLDTLEWGMACRQHGLCSHPSAACFGEGVRR